MNRTEATTAKKRAFPWVALKEQHLLQVAEGPLLSPTAYRLEIILVSYLNSRSREAFPSEETLADRLGLDRGANEDDPQRRARMRADATKMVRRGRDALVAAGHWTFKWKDGHLSYSPQFHETELSQAWDSIVSSEGQHSLRRETAQPSEPKKEPKKEPSARTSLASPPDGGSRSAPELPVGLQRDPTFFGVPVDCQWVGDRDRLAIFRNCEKEFRVPRYGGGDTVVVRLNGAGVHAQEAAND